jgi:antitoxin component YwqK of YwqJK toxin-antitoxin module
MKARIICISALLIMVFACKNNKSEKIEYNADGTIRKKTVFISSDKSQYREYTYYDGKQLEALQEYREGIRHGRSFNYYLNGNIKLVYYYDNDKLTCIGRYYDEAGQLTDKGLLINDSLMVKEEFFYNGDLLKVNVFSRLKDDFSEAGSLLYNNKGLFGLDNSFYYIANSLDSIPSGDSMKVDVSFIAHKEKGSHISLSIGNLDENLQFNKFKTYDSDSLSLEFYFKAEKQGYNLILGKLYYITDKPADSISEFIFYHDFLVY